ncbi:MAG: hypothetical protein M3070_13780 [Actinomycetota bacterium]|nr:hypothetical protein [Actinomycetota bacterium]
MAELKVIGAGHPGDPFQVQIGLDEGDLDTARSKRGLILDAANMGYDDDPQVRTVVVHIVSSDDS